MSQIAGTRGYVKDEGRLAELKALAKSKGLSLRESGEFDFQSQRPQAAGPKKEE